MAWTVSTLGNLVTETFNEQKPNMDLQQLLPKLEGAARPAWAGQACAGGFVFVVVVVVVELSKP